MLVPFACRSIEDYPFFSSVDTHRMGYLCSNHIRISYGYRIFFFFPMWSCYRAVGRAPVAYFGRINDVGRALAFYLAGPFSHSAESVRLPRPRMAIVIPFATAYFSGRCRHRCQGLRSRRKYTRQRKTGMTISPHASRRGLLTGSSGQEGALPYHPHPRYLFPGDGEPRRDDQVARVARRLVVTTLTSCSLAPRRCRCWWTWRRSSTQSGCRWRTRRRASIGSKAKKRGVVVWSSFTRYLTDGQPGRRDTRVRQEPRETIPVCLCVVDFWNDPTNLCASRHQEDHISSHLDHDWVTQRGWQ